MWLKSLQIITLILLGHLPLFSQNKEVASVAVSAGYLHENFQWSIAGTDSGHYHPNVLSELKWKNLKVPVVSVALKFNLVKDLFLKTNYNYGNIVSGTVNDRDYLDDNRTTNNYDGTFASDKGSVFALNANLGYTFRTDKNISLAPYIGYSVSSQNLFILGNDPSNQNVRSTYDTKWNGLNLGIHAVIKTWKFISIESEVIYQQLKYKSEANWNLIEKFKHPLSFEQNANAFKISGNVTIGFEINKSLSLFCYKYYSYWKTGEGVDQLYLQDGTTSKTRFNGAYRNSYSIGLGLKYKLLQRK